MLDADGAATGFEKLALNYDGSGLELDLQFSEIT